MKENNKLVTDEDKCEKYLFHSAPFGLVSSFYDTEAKLTTTTT